LPVSARKLRRASPEALVRILTPALALVGAVGMSPEDREEWIAAAAMALGHLPEEMLRDGIRVAMRKADHPSKIVPIVIEETRADLSFWRRQQEREQEAIALPAPGNERPTHEEVDQVLAEHGIPPSYGREEQRRHSGPPRIPTAEDYIALGLEPEHAQRAAREVARELIKTPRHYDAAKPIGAIPIPVRRAG
jgi:hypothetical protein